MEPGKYGQKLENNVRFGNFDLFTWIKKNFDGAILGETTGKNYVVLGITGICPLSGQRGIMNSGGE